MIGYDAWKTTEPSRRWDDEQDRLEKEFETYRDEHWQEHEEDQPMSARLSNDGGDQEAAYCDYITASPLGDPAEFIVDGWLDEFSLSNHDNPEFSRSSLRLQLLYILRANCDELERAENAARMGGEVGFEEWMEEQR